MIDHTNSGLLSAIACPTVSSCTALDAYGFAVTFDPHAPHRAELVGIDHPFLLNDIACPSAALCEAVDAGGQILEAHPPGHAGWASTRPIGAGQLMAIACPTSAECVAVDDDGQAYLGLRAPKITSAVESRNRWSRYQPRPGTSFAFRTDEPTKITITLSRRSGTRRIPAGHFTVNAPDERARVHFTGSALRPGRYTVRIVAVNANGVDSSPRQLQFTITA
jgi:hypothetical protein